MSLVEYREVGLDDAAHASDVMTAAYPPLPQDPVMTLQTWGWIKAREGYSSGLFLASLAGRDVAFLAWVHGPWSKLPERHCEIEVWLDRAAMDREVLRQMWEWLAERAVDEDARLLLAYAGEDEPEALDVLAGLGYDRVRLEKAWELDLSQHGRRLVEEAGGARRRMSDAGIRLLTLAEWDDAEKERKLHELDLRARQDVPHTLPIIPESFTEFQRRLHSPDRPAARYWVAVADGQAVALSYLKYPPVRGTVWTGFTCSHPDFRGRGIARAVKLQSLAQAVELGVPVVCTDNDSENAPMLHINETLGYHRRPGFVEHHKRVSNS